MSPVASVRRMERIRERLQSTDPQQATRRVMLVLAHEALRGEALAAAVAPAALRAGGGPTPTPSLGGDWDYGDLVGRVRERVRSAVPPASRILVLSRGDDALLLEGFDAAHFPQGPNGVYAGHHPADGPAAIGHLADCVSAGAQFLVLPSTGYWWLDYYVGFAAHLLLYGRAIHHDDNCLIIDLRGGNFA